jgi:hypothetical protein
MGGGISGTGNGKTSSRGGEFGRFWPGGGLQVGGDMSVSRWCGVRSAVGSRVAVVDHTGEG